MESCSNQIKCFISQLWNNTYSGAKKYLVSHQLCKFSHLKRWERPVIFIIGALQLWRTKWGEKNPENHIVGFLTPSCTSSFTNYLLYTTPTLSQHNWLAQTHQEGKIFHKLTFNKAHLLIEMHSRWLPHEAGWENAKGV